MQIILCTGTALAKNKIEYFSKGKIDWTVGQIEISGRAKPYPDASDRAEALRGAELSAKQQIWHSYIGMLPNIRMDSNYSVAGWLEKQTALRYRVRGVLRNFRQRSVKVLSGDEVEVETYFSLHEFFIQELLSDSVKPLPQEPVEITGQYSGVIIDARGTGLKPALLPKIRDNENILIFDGLNSAVLWDKGVLKYDTELSQAIKELVGSNPLKIKSIKSLGNLPVDMMVSSEDGLLLQKQEVRELLRHGLWAVLLD